MEWKKTKNPNVVAAAAANIGPAAGPSSVH